MTAAPASRAATLIAEPAITPPYFAGSLEGGTMFFNRI